MKKGLIRKGLVLSVIVLFVGLAVIPSTGISNIEKTTYKQSNGITLYVGGSGPNNYTTIQSAVDDANNGDTVFVYDDSSPYYENVVIDRSISLVGENKQTTVIDANYQGSPVKIYADGCLISGFTIQHCENPGSSWDFSDIEINDCQYVTIKDNILNLGSDNYSRAVAGVLVRASHNCNILNNYMFQGEDNYRTQGISLRNSTYNIVSGNEMTGYFRGIYMNNAHYNNFSNNYIHHNKVGIVSWSSEYNDYLNNRIEYNTYNGMDFEACGHNTISNNIISHNGDGKFISSGILLWLASSTSNYISNNEISYNSPYGIFLAGPLNNVITMNNFIDNGEGSSSAYRGHVFFEYYLVNLFAGYNPFGGNTWTENYWSDNLLGSIQLIRGKLYLWFQGIYWFNIDWNPASEPYEI